MNGAIMTPDEIGAYLEHQGATDDEIDEFLEHFGVKGMKWGVRRGQIKAKADAAVNKTKETAVSTGRYVKKNRIPIVKNTERAVVAAATIGLGLMWAKALRPTFSRETVDNFQKVGSLAKGQMDVGVSALRVMKNNGVLKLIP